MEMEIITRSIFRKQVLRFLDRQNLDPIFDLGHVDPKVLEVFSKVFSSENEYKDFKEFFPKFRRGQGSPIWEREGQLEYFNREYNPNILSTRGIGMDCYHFAKALIWMARSELDDMSKEELFIPIVMKWHIGAAILTSDMFGLDNEATILCWLPSHETFQEGLDKYIKDEWDDWGHENNDSFEEFYENRLTGGDAEGWARDEMQDRVILEALSELNNV